MDRESSEVVNSWRPLEPGPVSGVAPEIVNQDKKADTGTSEAQKAEPSQPQPVAEAKQPQVQSASEQPFEPKWRHMRDKADPLEGKNHWSDS